MLDAVLHDDHRALAPQPGDALEEIARPEGVEIGGWLVEDEGLGGHDQHGGEGQTLLLPSGEALQTPAAEPGQTGGGQRGGDPVGHGLPGDAQVLQAEGDLVFGDQVAELGLRVLEDDAHRAGQDAGLGGAGVQSGDDGGAARGRRESGAGSAR